MRAGAVTGQSPVAFYFSSGGAKDWTSPQNDALWRDGVKTLFDPCPEGWRVPRGGTGIATPWPDNLLTATEKIEPYPGPDGGYFLPAYPVRAVLNICGGRSCASGCFLGNSTRGWWWTSNRVAQSTREHARTLSIYSTAVINQSNPCGDSFSVRCVRR